MEKSPDSVPDNTKLDTAPDNSNCENDNTKLGIVPDNSTCESDNTKLGSRPTPASLYTRIISSGLRTISLQRDVSEPPVKDKTLYLEKLRDKNPGQFLYRFHSCLKPEDVVWFGEHSEDALVQFYLQKISSHDTTAGDKIFKDKVIRNRRYKKLGELLAEGTYFSEDEMKDRDQKLHYNLIGQYETTEEKETKVRDELLRNEAKFSSFLLHHSDKQEYNDMNMEEEEEEEEDSEEEEKTLEERQELCEVFKDVMIERFLSGADGDHIDYSEIDNNELYDDLIQRSRDLEDRYFDEESDKEDRVTLEDEREFNPPPLKAKEQEGS